jgi:CheY-like chemotaxis protein
MTDTALTSPPAARSAGNVASLLAAQKLVLEMIVQNRALPEVLSELCLIAEHLAPRPARASIRLVEPDGKHLTTAAAPNLPMAFSRAVDRIEIGPDVGTCAASAARGAVIVTADIASDPAWSAFSHLPLELGLRAAWSMPILSAAGIVLGTFATYFTQKREPLGQERSLAEVLARTAALAVERRRTQETLARLTTELTDQDRCKEGSLESLAHELRNRLAPVRSGLQLLRRGGSEEHLGHVREMMERQIGHLVSRVDNLTRAAEPTLSPAPGHLVSGTKPRRILVVDDNADAAATVALLLDLEGHETRVAHAGEAALLEAEEFQPEVVLLDLGLPGLSGLEVARRLREQAPRPESLRLVALTGWGSEDDRRQAWEAGFDRHLVKPVELDKLLEAVS